MNRGRPTKYKPEYCDAIVAFFSVPPYTEYRTPFGPKRSSNNLPTFGAFARGIGVNEDTVVEWSKKFEEFTAAYNAAKGLQKDFLVQNGLAGLYPPAFAIFTAKNITDMKDRQEFTGPDGEGIPMNLNVTSKTADELLRLLTAASANSARGRRRPPKAGRST